MTDVESVVLEEARAGSVSDGSEDPKDHIPLQPSKALMPTVRVRTDVLDALIDTVGELFIARERLRIELGPKVSQEVRSGLDALGNRIREIHDQVMAVRMMPLRTLTDKYPRLIRDLSRSLGKDVVLEIHGGRLSSTEPFSTISIRRLFILCAMQWITVLRRRTHVWQRAKCSVKHSHHRHQRSRCRARFHRGRRTRTGSRGIAATRGRNGGTDRNRCCPFVNPRMPGADLSTGIFYQGSSERRFRAGCWNGCSLGCH